MQELELAEQPVPVEVRPLPKAEAAPQSGSAGRFMLLFAVVVMAVLFAAVIRWALAHPLGVHWDEAEYFNDVQIDVHRLQSGMLLKFAGRILVKSWGRPPAFRLLADPLLALFGFHTFTARLISLVCYGFSACFVYLTVRRVASQAAAAMAALVFALSPEVVSASAFFGTDTSLYLAVAAMLYYLVAIWSDKADGTRNWIGLGLSLGLGFLAKTSFIVIALPLLAFWFVAAQWGKWGLRKPLSHWKAGVLALLIAGPWWIVNAKAAVAYGKYARGFVRNSLGTPSIVTGFRWLNTVIQCLFGHAISILLVLILTGYLVRVLARKSPIFAPLQKIVLVACACTGLPLVCAQLSGTNHLLRHISPAMIPLAISVGVLFEGIGWACSWPATAISCAVFCIQLGMLVAPVVSPNTQVADLGFVNGALPWRTLARFDQWDWTPVRDIADRCGLEDPKISYLGNGRAFNKPQIASPWVTRGASMNLPDPTWLWRYENGPLDWQNVMNSAEQSDMVVTAPHYEGEAKYKEDLDNRYNAEFAAQLAQDRHFKPPILLRMGRFEPVEVSVFVNKNLTCRAGQDSK
jgi:4-amino-4-deoxy-L-arabinose transferase-like glycosyltransferase